MESDIWYTILYKGSFTEKTKGCIVESQRRVHKALVLYKFLNRDCCVDTFNK